MKLSRKSGRQIYPLIHSGDFVATEHKNRWRKSIGQTGDIIFFLLN